MGTGFLQTKRAKLRSFHSLMRLVPLSPQRNYIKLINLPFLPTSQPSHPLTLAVTPRSSKYWLTACPMVALWFGCDKHVHTYCLFTHPKSPSRGEATSDQRTSDHLTSRHTTRQATQHGFRQTKPLSVQLPIALNNTLSRTMNVPMPIWKQLEGEKCGRGLRSGGSDVSALHLSVQVCTVHLFLERPKHIVLIVPTDCSDQGVNVRNSFSPLIIWVTLFTRLHSLCRSPLPQKRLSYQYLEHYFAEKGVFLSDPLPLRFLTSQLIDYSLSKIMMVW